MWKTVVMLASKLFDFSICYSIKASIIDDQCRCEISPTSPGLLLHLLGCLMCHRPESSRTSPSSSRPASSAASLACSSPPSTSTTTSLLQSSLEMPPSSSERRQGTKRSRSRRPLEEVILAISAFPTPQFMSVAGETTFEGLTEHCVPEDLQFSERIHNMLFQPAVGHLICQFLISWPVFANIS